MEVQKKLEDVFKLSGFPTWTFVRPVEYPRLCVSLRTPGRGLIAEGPSGIGKTTSVRKAMEELGVANKVQLFSARKTDHTELIDLLPQTQNFGTVIIDDFHKLKKSTQRGIADLMKLLADEESESCKIVIVGINKAGDSLIHFAPDLIDRIDRIQFETNPEEKIRRLIEKGEDALNIVIGVKEQIVSESQGSFHIAQKLCHEVCLAENVLTEQRNRKKLNISFEIVRERVFSQFTDRFFIVAKKFATGPRLQRMGRAPYLHLLYWLGSSIEWSIQIDGTLIHHPNQRNSVLQVVEKGYLLNHLRKNPAISDLVHFDPETRVLSIEDPKFVYYLRNLLWSKFAERIGYQTFEYDSKYDFALSFSRNARHLAKKLFDKLQENEISVFYDKNEQHRIIAQNVQDYLTPIYKSEARFIIALISNDYPTSVWTKFESEQFEQRFSKNAVIPIWLSNVNRNKYFLSSNIGGLNIDVGKSKNTQIDDIVAILKKMLAENLVKVKGIKSRSKPISEYTSLPDFPFCVEGKYVRIGDLYGRVENIGEYGTNIVIRDYNTGRKRTLLTSAVRKIK